MGTDGPPLPAACPSGHAQAEAQAWRDVGARACALCRVSARGEEHLHAENGLQAGRAPEELGNPVQMRFQSRGAGTRSLPRLSEGHT